LPADLSFRQGALIEPIAVACHDVRLGEVKAGEYVVVQGGGPIGLLVALAAKSAGANVVVSEINSYRLGLAGELGLGTVNPRDTDLVEYVNAQTGGAGADVVFEVTGTAAGADLMTKLPRTRGRIVVVAIFSEPPKVELFKFFWRELKMLGARVYEPQDFEQAIELAASGTVPLNRIVTKVLPLAELGSGFREMERGGEVMKILIECSAE
jgi:2-desacetyl-2-hydroxyethyl bacteriochlorophyllide A dehydrogenase